LNLIQIDNFQTSNEILFVLDSISKNAGKSLSKLGLQKILYLAKVLEPVREIIMNTLEFLTEKRGPYSKEIQNLIDHLTALGFVSITNFKVIVGKNSLAYYEITPVGEGVVKKLKKIPIQEEKYWWIDIISRLTIIYSNKVELENDTKFFDLDRIVRLVYQDPTYNLFKQNNNWKYFIDFEKRDENSTSWIIDFVKTYVEENNLIVGQKFIRGNAELITIAFFEFYFLNYLKSR